MLICPQLEQNEKRTNSLLFLFKWLHVQNDRSKMNLILTNLRPFPPVQVTWWPTSLPTCTSHVVAYVPSHLYKSRGGPTHSWRSKKRKRLFYSQTSVCKERLVSNQPEGPERDENMKAWCISHHLQMNMYLRKKSPPHQASCIKKEDVWKQAKFKSSVIWWGTKLLRKKLH